MRSLYDRRPSFLDYATFHWAGFTADVKSLEGGGWVVSSHHDVMRMYQVLEARHRSSNLCFRQHVSEELLMDCRGRLPTFHVDFTKAFQPPKEDVPQLLQRILKLQEVP